MKQLYTFLFAICYIPIIFCSCAKKKTLTVDTALQQAYSFSQGTYWIYKDSISGDIDSFFVTSNSIVSVETDDNIDDRIFITISEYSKYRPKVETSQWELLLIHNTIDLSWIQNNATPISRPNYNYDPLASYPFVIGAIVNDVHYAATVMQKFDTYSVESNIFNKVTLINDSLTLAPNNSYPYMNDWFYLSDGIGIIKMHLYHPLDTVNRVWELQRWNTSGKHQR